MPTGYVIADGKGNAGQVLTSQGTSSPASWASYSAGALGYYGSFYDTSTTYAALANTAYQIPIGVTAENNGVSLSSNNVVFAYGGTYSVTFSIQFANTDNTDAHDVTAWIKKNGVNIPYSASVAAIPRKKSSVNGQYIMTVNLVSTFNAGDAIGLWWQADTGSNTLVVETIPDGVAPDSPAVIFTATMVTYVQNPSQPFDYGKSICAAQGWFMP